MNGAVLIGNGIEGVRRCAYFHIDGKGSAGIYGCQEQDSEHRENQAEFDCCNAIRRCGEVPFAVCNHVYYPTFMLLRSNMETGSGKRCLRLGGEERWERRKSEINERLAEYRSLKV